MLYSVQVVSIISSVIGKEIIATSAQGLSHLSAVLDTIVELEPTTLSILLLLAALLSSSLTGVLLV